MQACFGFILYMVSSFGTNELQQHASDDARNSDIVSDGLIMTVDYSQKQKLDKRFSRSLSRLCFLPQINWQGENAKNAG